MSPRYRSPVWWVLLVAAVMLTMVAATSWTADAAVPSCLSDRVVTVCVDGWEPPACFDDEPCWDCATMGNRVCGPVDEPAVWVEPLSAPTCSTGDQYRQGYTCSPAPSLGWTPGQTCRQVWTAYPSPSRWTTICRGPA